MYRVRFIIAIIILAVALHFTAKTLRGVLEMLSLQPTVAASSASIPNVQSPSLFKEFLKQFKRIRSASVKSKDSEKVLLVQVFPSPAAPVSSNTKPLLQIVNEDNKEPFSNQNLTEEISTQLEHQFEKQRAANTFLANEIRALFGVEAQQEVILTLTQAEQAQYKDAQSCKTLKEYQKKQARREKKTAQQLKRIFERYKSSFNYQTKSNTPDWNAFYKRVNDFRRAQD